MHKSALFMLAIFFSNLCTADIIFIGGVKQTASDFESPNDTTRIATFDVFGDNGQELIFDITAIVEGQGKIRHDISCSTSPTPTGIGGSSILQKQCSLSDNPNISDFMFDVSMTAYCYSSANPIGTRIEIGKDRDNRNNYTNFPILDLNRDVTLTIDSSTYTNGNCEKLQVTLSSYLRKFDHINLEAIISTPF